MIVIYLYWKIPCFANSLIVSHSLSTGTPYKSYSSRIDVLPAFLFVHYDRNLSFHVNSEIHTISCVAFRLASQYGSSGFYD